jgi:hypothetical protein
MMNRDDVLRELELLPVWQLRASPKIVKADIAEQPLQQAIEIAPIIETATEAESLELHISADKKWIFALPKDRMAIGLQSSLFNNILHALQVEKTNTFELENLADCGAKVIIAMGEATAQQLLNSTESIEQLRGNLHTYQQIVLIVTYHPKDMLQYLPNKAKTWDDLCLALSIVNA